MSPRNNNKLKLFCYVIYIAKSDIKFNLSKNHLNSIKMTIHNQKNGLFSIFIS